MKRYLIEIILILSFPFIIFLILINYGDWSSDSFYYKVSSLKQKSMIIGSSRALQGLNPDILNEKLNRSDIFNFAFTNLHSPYGQQYLSFIKNKIDQSSNNNIYFLCVNPWIISSKTKNPNDVERFRELKSNLLVEDYSNGFNGKFKYYYDHYNQALYELIYNFRKITVLNKNGYLKLNLKKDSGRLERKIQHYIYNMLPNYNFSTIRYGYIEKTINFLKDYGTVYLIRLPIHEKMYQIENRLLKNFDDLIITLSKKYKIKYINLTSFNDEYNYTDGNHLEYQSAKKVSELIALEIKSHE
tara:strand:+ start:316 stop:1215 length:900 start_codon:yes stop_codon:yes gene_type:complete